MFTLEVKPTEIYIQVHHAAVIIDNCWLQNISKDIRSIEIIIQKGPPESVIVKMNGVIKHQPYLTVDIFKEQMYKLGVTYIDFFWNHNSN